MDFAGVLHSASRKTILSTVAGAVCYLALTAFLISEIAERVQPSARAPAQAYFQAEAAVSSEPCADLSRADRDICRAELVVNNVDARLRQQRVAYEERRAVSAPAVLRRGVVAETVAAVR